MEFTFSVVINKPLRAVFAFFRDVERHAPRTGTMVPVYIKTTPGPVGVGTQYLEMIQLMPFVKGKVLSTVVGFKSDRQLSYRYVALGMDGELTYRFDVLAGGTQVLQKQSLCPRGMLRLFSPLIGAMFSKVASRRLWGIKRVLEKDGSG